MTQAFNLAQFANNLNSAGQAAAGTSLTGAVPVANGGTGLTTLTANNVILGNDTSNVQLIAPGTTGNVLTSNGTTWSSAAISSPYVGGRGQAFTATGTFTVPAAITAVKVTVIGGGGGSGGSTGGCCGSPAGGGGGGGGSVRYITGLTPGATVTVTVGLGGTAGAAGGSGGTGGTSSFGAYCSATGGAGSSPGSGAAGGSGSSGSFNSAGSRGSRPLAGSFGGSAFIYSVATAGAAASAALAGQSFGSGAAGQGQVGSVVGAVGGGGLVVVEY